MLNLLIFTSYAVVIAVTQYKDNDRYLDVLLSNKLGTSNVNLQPGNC